MTRRTLFAIALFIFTLPRAVQADVTTKSIVRSGGFKGMGAFNGQTEEMLQGSKSRSNRSIKYQNALMRLAAGGDHNEILRLDLDKMWGLNLKKKTYIERSITPPPVEPKKEKTEKPVGTTPEKDEKPTHRLKKADFTVKKTGDKKEINGYKTERTLANAVIEVEEIATQEVTAYHLDTNLWVTPWTKTLRQARDEQTQFAKAFMQKRGLVFPSEQSKTFDVSSVKMLLGVGGPKTEETLENLKKKMDTIEGYPIATETIWTVKEDPKAIARREHEKKQAKETEEGDAIDTSGGASSIASGLVGHFAKKKMKEKQEKSAQKQASEPLLSTYHEVQSIAVDPVAESNFEVPAGFKKVEK